MNLYIKDGHSLMKWQTEEADPKHAINDLRHHLHGYHGRILALITEIPSIPQYPMPNGECNYTGAA